MAERSKTDPGGSEQTQYHQSGQTLVFQKSLIYNWQFAVLKKNVFGSKNTHVVYIISISCMYITIFFLLFLMIFILYICWNSWYPSAPVNMTSIQILIVSGEGAIKKYVLSLVFIQNVTLVLGDLTWFMWST